MRCLASLCACVAIAAGVTACGDGAGVDKPDTEKQAVTAFRSAGVKVPLVLHYGRSCHGKSWPGEAISGSYIVEVLYACGQLGDLRISNDIPAAILLVDEPGVSNYLVSIYRSPAAAAADPFWAAEFYSKQSNSNAPYRFGPFHLLRKDNVVVSGFMRPAEIASAKRALARL